MVAATSGIHGRTMGALALTGEPAKAYPFRPLPGDVTFVPYGDAEALAAAVDDTVAAVILEPIQGEAGVVVPPPDYLLRARRITLDAGALPSSTRCSRASAAPAPGWLSTQESPSTHIVSLAKGLAGGLPIGAMIRLDHPPTPQFERGTHHGSTFGANRSLRASRSTGRPRHE